MIVQIILVASMGVDYLTEVSGRMDRFALVHPVDNSSGEAVGLCGLGYYWARAKRVNANARHIQISCSGLQLQPDMTMSERPIDSHDCLHPHLQNLL